MKNCKKVISQKEIETNVKKLATKFNKIYANKDVTLLVVLTGAVNFAYDLAKYLKFKVNFVLVEASSYTNNQNNKEVKINTNYDFDIKNKHILIIEDIVETGNTMKKIIELVKKNKPKSVALATIFAVKTIDDLDHYILFPKKPDGFLVGYGFDNNEYYRNLQYICSIKK